MISKLTFRALLLAVVSTLSATASASTWNTFTSIGTDNLLFFFDADTVQKQGDKVTVWVKYVNLAKPDSDGSWNTTTKYQFSCGMRKYDQIAQSTYDKEGGFLRSSMKQSLGVEFAPDTIIEAIYNVVCTKDFPRGKNKDVYFPVLENNVPAHVKRYLEYTEAHTDTAPK